MGYKKQLVELQPMLHRSDGCDEDHQVVHIVNNCQMGGEFTLCGCAIVDSTLQDEQFMQDGDSYFGVVSQCTCQSCRDLVRYVQSMRWR